MYLVFDLETTDLVKCVKFNVYPNYKNLDRYESARIVQIAWIVLDKNFETIFTQSFIVKRDNFDIKNSNFHSVTNEISDKSGINFELIMFNFMKDLSNCDTLVSHNILFDFNVLASNLYRYNLFGILNEFEKKSQYCTSVNSTEVTKIPMPFYSKNYKYPSLMELYYFYFNENFDNAHDALNDTKACAKVFVKLKTLEVFRLKTF